MAAAGAFTVTPVEAALHLLNFAAPACWMAGLTALCAKIVWRFELRAVGWFRLLTAAAVPAALAALIGLIVTGRDGKMGTYGAMAAACAVGVWACFPRKS